MQIASRGGDESRRSREAKRDPTSCLSSIDGYTSLTYGRIVIFIETPTFTKQIQALVDDAAYATFQAELASAPDAGDLIEGTGGLRKIRMRLPGRGKRGGARVIYYHVSAAAQIRLLFAYPKNVADALTADQKKQLAAIVEKWR